MRLKKLLVFFLCLLPLGWLVLMAVNNALAPDPGKAIVLFTGSWALRFLIVTLAITPLKRITGASVLLRYRRMMGLYVWFYASLHLLAVMTYLLGWSWAIFLEEFIQRPYMALGIIAWLLLVPLGLTSNRWMIKKLGQHWKSLHKLIYLIAVLVCGHFIWLVRSDFGEALSYTVVVAVLLLFRLTRVKRKPPASNAQISSTS